VNAPQFLGSCDNLLLDATGSYGNGGRLYNAVVWTVSATDATVDLSNVQSYLDSASALYQVFRLITMTLSHYSLCLLSSNAMYHIPIVTIISLTFVVMIMVAIMTKVVLMIITMT
jgi:hypothetical protein